MSQPSAWDRVNAVAGWAGVALFAVIYAVELLPHHGRPVTLRWISDTFGQGGLIALNIAIVAAYVWLALYEERQAAAEFGAAWDAYAARTKRFVPGLL